MGNFLFFVQKFFLEYKNHLLAILFSFISLFIYSNGENKAVRGFKAVGLQVLGSLKSLSNNVSGFFLLHDENERLKDENKRLTAKLQTFLSASDVDDKKDSAHIQQSILSKLIKGEVIHKNYDDVYNFITINLGQKEGIGEEMCVLSERGLVGRVVFTGWDYAIVQTVINRDFRVAAMTESKLHGILEWGGGDYTEASMNYIPVQSLVEVNETVYTSRFSSFAMKGIEIGKVQNVTRPKDSFFYDVTISLSVNFSKLGYVYVLMERQNLKNAKLDSLYQSLK